jgi:ATP-dependent helicase/nuclease subunit B
MLIQAVWAGVLREAALDAFPALIPIKLTDRSFRWALQTATLLQRLREQLAEAGLVIADVPEKAGELLAEPERWRDLARLEARYLAALKATGFGDPCERKRILPAGDTLPADVDSVILAGVPDPPDLVIRLLDRYARSLPVTVLVHAPADRASAFDAWGRPLPDIWSRHELDIPDEAKTLILAADPEDQARRVMTELDAASARFGAGDVAIGVPDPEVAPFLAQVLADRNVKAFDPSEPQLSRQPACRLLTLLQALAATPVYRTVADLLRQEDVLNVLVSRFKLSPVSLLTDLDNFQNTFMPLELDDFTDARLQGCDRIADLRDNHFIHLEKGIFYLRELRHSLLTPPSPIEGVRLAMQSVYGGRFLADQDPQDREFTAVGSAINEALSELESTLPHVPGLNRAESLELLVETLASQKLPREIEAADLDLEGWLELPWNPSPFLIVTGLNEGFVPDSRMGDVFLPDSLRAHLGMRHDGSRVARDLFLLESLIESRRQAGTIRLLCGKTSAAGDPLKPSRLLFQCPDSALPSRAARLFEELKSHGSLPAASISFQLQSSLGERPPVWPAEKAISVTAFRDYLECPFRFYLRHLLGMESLNDQKTEPDAMEFGQLIHHALRQLHDIADLRACSDEARIRDALQDAARGWMRGRYGDAWSLPLRIVYEAAQNRLAAVAKRQAAEAANGWVILAAETSWTLSLGGLTIKGKIDRIDYHPETHAARILDYKTSSRAKTCQEAHQASVRDDTPAYAIAPLGDKQKRWIDLQLPLYALMWKANPLKADASLKVGYFLVPPSLEDTRVQLWDELSEPILDSAQRCAEGVCEAVRGGVFWPPAERVAFEDHYRNSLGGELNALFTPLKPGGAP